MKLKLAYYGDPILRKKAKPVEEINDQLRALVSDMIETMDAADGVGLAAPQVHQSIALFVTRIPIKRDDETWDEGEARVFINPKIWSSSPELELDSEGCLSIPKIYADVARPIQIVVEAIDLDGNTFLENFWHLGARVILHENDHINGVLFLDRLPIEERKKLEKLYAEGKGTEGT